MNAADRFRALKAEVAPLDSAAGKLKVEMMQLAQEMGLETIRKAFPQARIVTLRPICEVKPSDMAHEATKAVEAIQQSERIPTLIIVDKSRCILTLAEEDLPPAAKSKEKGKR